MNAKNEKELHRHQNENDGDIKQKSGPLPDVLQGDTERTSPRKKSIEPRHQPFWRIEPEIEPARQEQLMHCLATIPDISRNRYPFKGMKLNRADIEWLLVTFANTNGTSSGNDEDHEQCIGLDLRGADLRCADLHALPLTSLHGSLTQKEWNEATEGQRTAATILLTGADLSEAHLEYAELIEVHLEKASLREAHLEQAVLAKAHLEHAFLGRAYLQQANLNDAHLAKTDLSEVQLQNATLRRVHLEQAYLSGAHLEKAELNNARLEKAYLRGAYLEQANLNDAHLEESYLGEAHLHMATLSGAHLEGAYLNEAHLEDTFLYKAHLERTFLYKAHLEGARLSKTQVVDTHLKKAWESGEQHIGPSVADAQWGSVNLAVVQWSQIDMLGDEYKARQLREAGKRKNDINRLAEYETAVRANRQLAVALRAQGLDEDAARFAYRAQLLQRTVLRRQGRLGSYLFSGCLDFLAGYGYKPSRSLIAYLATIFGFMALYLLSAQGAATHLRWDEALILSISCFHGRGFLLQNVAIGDTFARLAAVEAILGLLIEINFIATFTQRFLGR